MTDRVGKAGLQVAAELVEFIETLALPGTGISAEVFWEGLSSTVAEFHPRIQAALEIRADFQSQIDAWHVERRGQAHDAAAYEAFLREIGYLIP